MEQMFRSHQLCLQVSFVTVRRRHSEYPSRICCRIQWPSVLNSEVANECSAARNHSFANSFARLERSVGETAVVAAICNPSSLAGRLALFEPCSPLTSSQLTNYL